MHFKVVASNSFVFISHNPPFGWVVIFILRAQPNPSGWVVRAQKISSTTHITTCNTHCNTHHNLQHTSQPATHITTCNTHCNTHCSLVHTLMFTTQPFGLGCHLTLQHFKQHTSQAQHTSQPSGWVHNLQHT